MEMRACVDGWGRARKWGSEHWERGSFYMQEKTVCVTGHRTIPAGQLDYVQRELEREVLAALEDGYRVFLSGFAQGVDMIFIEIVDAQRDRYPSIFLEAAIPHPGRTGSLSPHERKLLSKCDGVGVISEKYHSGCFFKRNRYLTCGYFCPCATEISLPPGSRIVCFSPLYTYSV